MVREYQFLFNNVNTVHRIAISLDAAFATGAEWCKEEHVKVKEVLPPVNEASKNKDAMRNNIAIAAITSCLCEKPRPASFSTTLKACLAFTKQIGYKLEHLPKFVKQLLSEANKKEKESVPEGSSSPPPPLPLPPPAAPTPALPAKRKFSNVTK